MKHLEIDFQGVAIDSRKVLPGQLFVAIPGEKVDGHDFVKNALNNGASRVLVSRQLPDVDLEKQWVVEDTVATLSALAVQHRLACDCLIIAITGSNGKTSVKEMCKKILPEPSYASLGNFNNHLGVPICLMQLKPEHRYAVFELGANHIGEIAHTVAMVKPQVALINNIGPAHIGEFGGIEGVARAKGEIYAGLGDSGIAVVNADDAYAHFWDDIIHPRKVLRFGVSQDADVMAKEIQFENMCARWVLVTPQGEISIAMKVPGLHNIYNALAAASATLALGISLDNIAQGLEAFEGVPGRMAVLTGYQGATIIDDTYNANLRSVQAAIAVLAKRSGRRVLVLGDMGELGDWAIEHHRAVGLSARESGIDALYSYGDLSRRAAEEFGVNGQSFITKEELIDVLRPELDENTTILIKGSRSSAMERIVEQLVEKL